MKITFYGTRGIFPPGAQTSCAWVDAPGGSFAIDLGSTLLFEEKARVAALDHVLLTHLHPDHIAMLPRLLAERPDCTFVAPEFVSEVRKHLNPGIELIAAMDGLVLDLG